MASTTLTASVRMLLSFAIDRKSEGHTVCAADVKNGSPQRKREGRRRCARPTLRLSGALRLWTALWEQSCGKLERCLHGLRRAPTPCQEHLGNILTKAGCVSNQLDSLVSDAAGRSRKHGKCCKEVDRSSFVDFLQSVRR